MGHYHKWDLTLDTDAVVDARDDVLEGLEADQDNLRRDLLSLVDHQAGAEVALVVDVVAEVDVGGGEVPDPGVQAVLHHLLLLQDPHDLRVAGHVLVLHHDPNFLC